MRYSYDPKKRLANLKKHGLDFDDVPHLFEQSKTVTFEDRRHRYDEERFVTLGLLRGEVVLVVTTETDEVIHTISMRKADKNEQAIYFRNVE